VLLLICLALACGEDPITGETADTGEEPDTEDTQDTEPVPVWDEQRIETADTLNSVYASGQGIYVAASDGTFYNYKASTGWVGEQLEVEEEDLNGIWGSGSGDTLSWVVVGDAGQVVQYTTGTTSVTDLGTANFEAVDGTVADTLTAVGWGGAFTWNGIEWTYETLPGNERLNDVWVSGTSAIGVGEEGAILRREGGSWVSMTSPTELALFGVGGAADNDLWAVGQDGVVLHFNGSLWEEQESFTLQSLWAVYAPTTSAVYVVGNNGTAFRYDGEAWSELYTGVDENLYAVHGASTADCWAVGNRGTALHYTGS